MLIEKIKYSKAMKRIIVVFIAFFIGLSSCNDKLDDMFLNPDAATEAKIEYLFTQGLLNAPLRIEYWDGYTMIYDNLVAWSQFLGSSGNDSRMMEGSQNWIQDHWNSYFTSRMMMFQEIERLYDLMPEEQKANYEVYLVLGKIMQAFNTANATDLWGDIPYSEAFTARLPEQNLFVKFDTQESVYDAIIADLKAASDALKGISLNNSPQHQALVTQDILNHGDLMKWQMFANSLRLRLGMRLSEVSPQKASAVVGDVLGAGSGYPLVESNAQNIIREAALPDGSSEGAFNRATFERRDKTFAGKLMMDIMNASADPRIPVYFQPSEVGGQFVGIPSSPDEQSGLDITIDDFAYLHRTYFEENEFFPGVVISAAEVSFLKAEAYQRGWATGDAEAAYNMALAQSIEMYYSIARLKESTIADPDQATIDAFINTSSAQYDGTLEQIATQRWINSFVVQPYETFAEQRRTDFPTLPDDMSGGTKLARATRVIYPPTEILNNAENYAAVQDNDTFTHRVWWDVN